ncbi:Methyl-accepting chemotaxis protein [Candidatus Desulfosporosinus infrequens]|uniref:Methyl-accepting chemotaxis protein n=1 Tax=Candidatus Desulfosporosinus infrequens TaxID=2043169 RepID=A0A2U3LT13_9FIRM|nr:Methyl-accepting chemotaxis protein [Candidatus Desulfosporosinus infrequens]
MAFFKREQATAVSDEADYNKVYQCLLQCDFSKQIDVDIQPTSRIYPVVEILNRIIAERQTSASTSLAELDKTVQDLTSLTSIRQMLVKAGEQSTQLANMAAQAEQLGAAANQVANSATNSATFVEQAASSASSGGEKIRQAIQFVEHSFDEFAKVSLQVQEVLNSMQEIEQIVGVIAGVADQTNLLALNAAIEAARAGEQGRGFAVVADEVRKLAEHTKASVTDIRLKMVGLSQNSQETTKSIASLSNTMQTGKGIMQEAAESLQGIVHNFGEITEDIQNIAAGSQEQSAAVQESASSVATIAMAAEEIEQFANVTGQGIYNISQALQNIRTEQVARVPYLGTHQSLELYKTDHMLWTWRIYNMILGFERIKSSEVGNHHECRLGHWYEEHNSEKCRSLPAFRELESPHKMVHELAREATVAYEQGNIAKAEQILERMGQASREVVVILEELQRRCQD